MREKHTRWESRPRIVVQTSHVCPIGLGRPLEGFRLLPLEARRTHASAALSGALRLGLGDEQFILGHLPDDRWAMAGRDEHAYRFAVEKRPSGRGARTCSYGHISPITPLTAEEGERLLRGLFAEMSVQEWDEDTQRSLQRRLWREELLAAIDL